MEQSSGIITGLVEMTEVIPIQEVRSFLYECLEDYVAKDTDSGRSLSKKIFAINSIVKALENVEVWKGLQKQLR